MYISPGNEATDKLVIEMDVAFGNINTDKVSPFMQICGIGNGKRSDIYLANTADGKVTVGHWATATEGTKPVLDANKWYNLRLEFFADGKISVYVDGEFACTVGGLDFNKYSANSINLMLHSYATDEYIAYDNIYVGYVAE